MRKEKDHYMKWYFVSKITENLNIELTLCVNVYLQIIQICDAKRQSVCTYDLISLHLQRLILQDIGAFFTLPCIILHW